MPESGEEISEVLLHWLPLGAGDSTGWVRTSGALYEHVVAAVGRRPAVPLFHSALEVYLDGTTWVIEMAPVWGPPAGDHGAAVLGPVGLRPLGRWRLFRYEVRRWRAGVIPDLAYAVGGPVKPVTDPLRARRLLASVATVPAATWGRDELRCGEMWNSNSVVSWLLAVSDHEVAGMVPPDGGRAPGWDAGLAAAARHPRRLPTAGAPGDTSAGGSHARQGAFLVAKPPP